MRFRHLKLMILYLQYLYRISTKLDHQFIFNAENSRIKMIFGSQPFSCLHQFQSSKSCCIFITSLYVTYFSCRSDFIHFCSATRYHELPFHELPPQKTSQTGQCPMPRCTKRENSLSGHARVFRSPTYIICSIRQDFFSCDRRNQFMKGIWVVDPAAFIYAQ